MNSIDHTCRHELRIISVRIVRSTYTKTRKMSINVFALSSAHTQRRNAYSRLRVDHSHSRAPRSSKVICLSITFNR